MQAILEIPDVVKNAGVDKRYIEETIAASLYYNGKLSEKEACLMIGVSRRVFEEDILPKFGLSMVGGSHEDIEFEINSKI